MHRVALDEGALRVSALANEQAEREGIGRADARRRRLERGAERGREEQLGAVGLELFGTALLAARVVLAVVPQAVLVRHEGHLAVFARDHDARVAERG